MVVAVADVVAVVAVVVAALRATPNAVWVCVVVVRGMAWTARSHCARKTAVSSAGAGSDPVMAFETEETKQILAEAINGLPEREKVVVTLYYYEGLTLAEIGKVLGVTESRICQMHSKAVIQMRSKMAEVGQG